MLHQPRSDRIVQNIAEDGEQMAVLLNREAFESALPHMPMTTVVPMIATDLTGHPPVHEGAEGRITDWLEHKMKMVGHHAKGEYLDGMSGFRGGEQFQKGSVVAVGVKHGGAAVAAIEDMEGMAGQMAARDAGHGERIRRAAARFKRKVACPLFLSLLATSRQAHKILVFVDGTVHGYFYFGKAGILEDKAVVVS